MDSRRIIVGVATSPPSRHAADTTKPLGHVRRQHELADPIAASKPVCGKMKAVGRRPPVYLTELGQCFPANGSRSLVVCDKGYFNRICTQFRKLAVDSSIYDLVYELISMAVCLPRARQLAVCKEPALNISISVLCVPTYRLRAHRQIHKQRPYIGS